MHDADAVPVAGFSVLHWGVINIPVGNNYIMENASNTIRMPSGAVELNNAAGAKGYLGMCTPAGRHHLYRITIFARSVSQSNVPMTGHADLVISSLMGDGNTIAVSESMSLFPEYHY